MKGNYVRANAPVFYVDKHVPLPNIKPMYQYPFLQMDLNDSFAFPETMRPRIKSAAYMHARKYGRTFYIGKTRVWRTT